MSLVKVGITACGGGVIAKENGTFGSFENLDVYKRQMQQCMPYTIKNRKIL